MCLEINVRSLYLCNCSLWCSFWGKHFKLQVIKIFDSCLCGNKCLWAFRAKETESALQLSESRSQELMKALAKEQEQSMEMTSNLKKEVNSLHEVWVICNSKLLVSPEMIHTFTYITSWCVFVSS